MKVTYYAVQLAFDADMIAHIIYLLSKFPVKI